MITKAYQQSHLAVGQENTATRVKYVVGSLLSGVVEIDWEVVSSGRVYGGHGVCEGVGVGYCKPTTVVINPTDVRLTDLMACSGNSW